MTSVNEVLIWNCPSLEANRRFHLLPALEGKLSTETLLSVESGKWSGMRPTIGWHQIGRGRAGSGPLEEDYRIDCVRARGKKRPFCLFMCLLFYPLYLKWPLNVFYGANIGLHVYKQRNMNVCEMPFIRRFYFEPIIFCVWFRLYITYLFGATGISDYFLRYY